MFKGAKGVMLTHRSRKWWVFNALISVMALALLYSSYTLRRVNGKKEAKQITDYSLITLTGKVKGGSWIWLETDY